MPPHARLARREYGNSGAFDPSRFAPSGAQTSPGQSLGTPVSRSAILDSTDPYRVHRLYRRCSGITVSQRGIRTEGSEQSIFSVT